MTLSVLYQDDDLIVVDKPSGLLCVPGLREPDNLFDRAKQAYPSARVVHRLDMATSGIVIFPLNYPTQKHLGKQFESRKVRKQYLAIVDGNLGSQLGHVSVPTLCDWERRPIQKVDWLNGKWGETGFHVIERYSSSTRVKLKPFTGRTHQLRVHMWHIGHPILGDKFYNFGGSEQRASRLQLHAHTIEFEHPTTGKAIHIESPTPF